MHYPLLHTNLKRALSIALLSQFFLAPATAAAESLAKNAKRPEKGENDDPRARFIFTKQRRGSTKGKSAGRLRLEAVKHFDRMVQREREASRKKQVGLAGDSRISKYTFPGTPSTWLPVGPAPSRTNFESSFYQSSSGRVTALAVDPCDPTGNRVYAGAANGGVWKSVNGGDTWEPISDFIASLAVGALAITGVPGNCDESVLVLGTGEQSFAADSYYGAGIFGYKKDPGTEKFDWMPLGVNGANPFNGTDGGLADDVPTIGGISIQPGSGGNVILAAVRGFPSGIYRTNDGGATWGPVLELPGNQFGATSVSFAPNDQQIAYGGVYGEGVYRSEDGGESFTSILAAGAHVNDPGRVEIAVYQDEVNGEIVYALVAQDQGNNLAGMFKIVRIPSGGLTVTKLTVPDFCSAQCWYDLVVAVHPLNPNIVFVGGSAGALSEGQFLLKSVDGGSTWSDATGAAQRIHVDQHAMAFSPDGSKLYVGNDGGIYSTAATSATPSPVDWENRNGNLNITQFYKHFGIHPTDINRTLGGTQDNGMQRLNSTNDPVWDEIACGDGASAVYDPANPNRVHVNCQFVQILISTTGNIDTFSLADNGIEEGGLFIAPLVGDPIQSKRLYFGGTKLWRTDNGVTWFALNRGLPFTANAATRRHGISTIAVVPLESNVIYVGTSDGKIFRGTASSSASFANITANLPNSEFVTSLTVDPVNSSIVYATVAGFNEGQHVFRYEGSIWHDIDSGLPNVPANDIVVDPHIPGSLYVAMDVGVYHSPDGGATWETLGAELPKTAIVGLQLHKPSRTLRAATHGRGMWDLFIPISGPHLVFEPAVLTFEPSKAGLTSNPQTVRLMNVGSTEATITAVSSSTEFRADAQDCIRELGPGEYCAFSVSFTPETAGVRPAFIALTTVEPVPPALVFVSGLGLIPATNDLRSAAKQVPTTPFVDVVTTSETTALDLSDPAPLCGPAGLDLRNHSVWYTYTAAHNGSLTIDTRDSDFDTVVSIWQLPGLSAVGCNDDVIRGYERESLLTLDVTAGQQYGIMASGFSAEDFGTLHFLLSTTSTPPPLPVDFTFTGPTDNRRINAGQTVTYPLSLTPVNGYTGTITFSCSDTVRAQVSCTFDPASVSFVGGNVSTTMTVTVTRANETVRAANQSQQLPFLPIGIAACLLLPAVGNSRKRRFGFVALLVALLGVTSCGGGGSEQRSQLPSQTLQPNDVPSSIIVTATGMGGSTGSVIVHRLELPITVVQ